MRAKQTVLILAIILLIASGCASSLKVLVGKEKLVRIPQIVAHLEPTLEKDKFLVFGKIVLQNPGESDLILGKINLTLQDESGNVLGKTEVDWQRQSLKSKDTLLAPVKFILPLEVLNKDLIQVTLFTNLIYKKANIQLPIKSKIAVLHLKSLKDSLMGPLELTIHSKLHSDILGNASIEYTLDIVNPFNVDLEMEEASLKIYTNEKPDIGKVSLTKILLIFKKQTQVKGTIKLKKAFSAIIIKEFLDGHAVRAKLNGILRIPKTDILIPFKIESVQEIDFSLFSKK
ncbi:MAG: hypothetical protein Q8O13_02995 [Candidatus Omnitrophota bacterium]|nr:hypothetical protein [Candidatus Omnitrophota bacterium]